ncbi:possible rod shape-determining protein MreD [Weissella oryzae SG25]|uniref:Possible rod shape-determining protein MreD n=1 Tax=Weissella oryzae (strain DSM 25784 / JCM 18191 / LMG 30913 / SG25) TaxID=1329250 RepID=A0A069CT85_WEIOS|nr:rod shape-determining protein MreD [Weissella oryzae]GAK30617.1 possible rod shape-determining protein MreD [Weissella oryzae SG25]
MKYIPMKWLHFFLVFIAMLLDGAIALNAAPVLFHQPMSASPFLTIIVLIIPIIGGFADQLSKQSLYGAAIVSGLLFDLFYNGVVGIAMVGFPLVVWIALIIKKYFATNFGSAVLTWFIALSAYLFFDYMAFGIINMANANLSSFIIFHMFPTILVNLLILLVVYNFLVWLYKKTLQEDIANYTIADKSLDNRIPLGRRK